MARVKFTADFDYRPNRQSLIAYKAGRTYPGVKREACDQAVAKGAATELKPARRRKASPTT